MTLFTSIAIASLFGSGCYLLLKADLIRVVAGTVLISNAVNIFIISAGLSRGVAAILPIPAGETLSDPLVQAMALTAVVITFGVSALLMSLVFRVYTSHLSLDLDDLARAEELEAEDDDHEHHGRDIYLWTAEEEAR